MWIASRKFFVIFAYPGVSGFLHVGHLRSYTYPDIIAKYKKLRGYKVFFPAGLHATGLPAVAFSLKVKRRDPVIINHLKQHGVDEETIKKLEDPEFAVRFFAREYLKTWKEMGYDVDEETLCTTIDEGYKRFIRWQMKKLEEKGYLIQKPHRSPYCPKCGPVAVDKSETDISKGGDAKVIEIILVKAKKDNYIIPISITEEKKLEKIIVSRGNYVIIKVGEENWIVNEESLKKFEWQKNAKIVEKVENIKNIIREKMEVDGIKVKVEYSEGRPWFGSGIIGITSEEIYNYKEKGTILDFDKEVVCRCGERVFIKPVPDQWFIKYSDPEVKKKAKEWIKKMIIKPEEFKKELIEHIIDWYGDRACTRKGRWLGTEWRGWIIEPISDSVIYPAYYIIAKFINRGLIREEQLCDEVFDYVFLGKGDPKEISEKTGIPEEVLRKMREEFDYWYPVDLNCGGKEHKTVHFPVYIMAHIMIFPEKYWPRGIFVNWWVTGKKGKISKSKGGAEPIPNLIQKYGADTLRLFYAMEADPHTDVVWDESKPLKYKKVLNRIKNIFERLLRNNSKEKKEIDIWIESRLRRTMEKYIEEMENYNIRDGIMTIIKFIEEVEWYLKRGKNKETSEKVLKSLLEMLYPFIPFTTKEYANKIGYKIEKIEIRGEINEEVEKRDEYIKKFIESVNNIKKIFERKGKIPKLMRVKFANEEEKKIIEENKEFLEEITRLKIVFDDSIEKEAKPGRPAILFEF